MGKTNTGNAGPKITSLEPPKVDPPQGRNILDVLSKIDPSIIQAAQMYAGVLDRIGEYDGIIYWASRIEEVGFSASIQEFLSHLQLGVQINSKYLPGVWEKYLGPKPMVDLLHWNTLGTLPTEESREFWFIYAMENNSIAKMIESFLFEVCKSPITIMKHKVQVGLYGGFIMENNRTQLPNNLTFLGVDETQESVISAIEKLIAENNKIKIDSPAEEGHVYDNPNPQDDCIDLVGVVDFNDGMNLFQHY